MRPPARILEKTVSSGFFLLFLHLSINPHASVAIPAICLLLWMPPKSDCQFLTSSGSRCASMPTKINTSSNTKWLRGPLESSNAHLRSQWFARFSKTVTSTSTKCPFLAAFPEPLEALLPIFLSSKSLCSNGTSEWRLSSCQLPVT